MLCDAMDDSESWKNMTLTHYLESYLRSFKHAFNILMLIRRKYKNYIQIMMNVSKGRYPIFAIPRGTSNRVAHQDFSSILIDIQSPPWDLASDVATIDGYKIYGVKRNAENILGIFLEGDYDFLDVCGKDVVDVGGNIADSSIYFVSRGAKRVIYLDPDVEYYRIAKKNIEANGLSNRVILLQASCGVRIERRVGNKCERVITLHDIVQAFNLEHAVLKIDCEGCEYDVILSSPSWIISRFTKIQIEYHYGYANIKKKLVDCGFNVRVTEPRYFKPRKNTGSEKFFDNVVRRGNIFFVGWLYAWKD